MKNRFLTTLILFGVLCALGLGQLVQLTESLVHQVPELRIETGRRRQATLTDELRERFQTFDEGIRISYYVSPRSEMPAHLSHLESSVRDVLQAFEHAALQASIPIRTQVIFPDQHPEWSIALGSTGLAPWRARRVEGDGYREDKVWSSLRIAYGPRPAAVLNGVGPAQVLELQNLLLEQLEELRTPRRPRIAISGPADGYDELRQLLNSGADVTEFDFDHEAQLPERIDLLFWIDPTRVEDRHLALLDGLRARGTSIILAGHDLHSSERALGDTIEVSMHQESTAMETLLQHHGLNPAKTLLLDPSAGEREAASTTGGPSVTQFVPWYARSTANHHDFRILVGQPNGSLLFRTPSAFFPDPNRLGELGLEATVLATAGDFATLHGAPTEPLSTEDVLKLAGQAQPNLALAALLQPAAPWGGRVMVLSDSAVFGDEYWNHEHYAHQAFNEVVLTNLLSSERLVAGRIALRTPALLPELTHAQRIGWRGIVVLALPCGLAIAFLLRNQRSGKAAQYSRPWRWVIASAIIALPTLQLLATLSRGVDLDLTQDNRNRLTPEQQAVFAAGLQESTKLELIFSPGAQLPPQYKPLVREVRRACDRLASRFDPLVVQEVWVENLSTEEQEQLASSGISPMAISSTKAEATRMFRVYASLRLSRGSQELVLNFSNERSFRHFHFRLAHALERLSRGAPTRIALFAEPPRLSPAEAMLEYQRKGLFAPREGDAYSASEELLSEFDFEVVRLEAGRDEVPEQLDALLWMQPRRNLLAMTQALSGHLQRGGSALVAGQHFRILSRQLERTGLQQRFWPEPQFYDLDRHYLPELGIDVPRLVCFDQQSGSMQMKTRVDGAQEDASYTLLPTSQSFLIESTAETPGGLQGTWRMPFASQVRWDPERLEQQGLEVTPWIHGGESPWTYDWSGGDLPDSVLSNSAPLQDQLANKLQQGTAPACYGALFSGPFPKASISTEDPGRLTLAPGEVSGEHGRLLLLGNSELFKNEHLTAPDYDHEDLLLRAVSNLALPSKLLPLLENPQNEPTLESQDEGTRSLWRLVVLGTPAALLLIIGLGRRRAA